MITQQMLKELEDIPERCMGCLSLMYHLHGGLCPWCESYLMGTGHKLIWQDGGIFGFRVISDNDGYKALWQRKRIIKHCLDHNEIIQDEELGHEQTT